MCALYAVEPGFCVPYMQNSLAAVCAVNRRDWVQWCAL
jgi:hypothetical protein